MFIDIIWNFYPSKEQFLSKKLSRTKQALSVFLDIVFMAQFYFPR